MNLYHSEWGLLDFQAEGVARSYLGRNQMVCWDTGCIQGDAEIIINRGGGGRRYPLSYVVHMLNGGKAKNGHRWDPSIPTMTQREVDGVVRLVEIARGWESGVKTTYTVTTSTGRTIRATDEHPFLTERGWLRLDELVPGDLVHVRGDQVSTGKQVKKHYRQRAGLIHHPHATHPTARKSKHRVSEHRLVMEASMNNLTLDDYLVRLREGPVNGLTFLDPKVVAVHHIDEDHRNNTSANLEVKPHHDHLVDHARPENVLYKIATEEVVSVERWGEEMTYDIEVVGDPHNFIANGFVVHNTGKTHHALALAALLFEDNLIDHCLVVCEQNKIGEWAEDFAEFTSLTTARYYGPKRKTLLDDPPQVMVSVYETIRNDAAEKVPGKSKALKPGVLTEALAGKRVLVVYDEATKLKNRSSGVYRHHEHMLHVLGKAHQDGARVIALTATPIEKDPENAFNIARLVWPGFMTVSQFEEEHVRGRDIYGRAYGFKNIGAGDHSEPWVTTFADKIAPILQVKHKSDPDVVDQFPKQVEEFTYVEQHPTEEKFYLAVRDVLSEMAEEDPFKEMAMFGVLRQIAAHPASVLRSQGQMARFIVEQVGEEGIRAIPCAKVDRLLAYLEPLVLGQGAQAVVFTFFGQSVLPLIHEALLAAGYTVSLNHGAMTSTQKEASRHDFIEGKTNIFLTSDAGSRGLNLPNAQYVVNYELPLTHANYIQRINRINRIDSQHDLVTCQSFITAYTVEEGVVRLNERRNEWSDLLLLDDDDDDSGTSHMTAEDRKAIISTARATVPKKDRSSRKVAWAA